MIDDLERWKIKMCAGTYVNKRGECDECPYDRIGVNNVR